MRIDVTQYIYVDAHHARRPARYPRAAERLQRFNDFLESADWWVCKLYIEEYTEDNFGYLTKETDEALMGKCYRVWERAGKPILEPHLVDEV